jgi:histidine triad (HIT) family protein
MKNSIFSDIIARKRPACFLHEDDVCVVIMDIFPINTGHALVIPKRQVQFLHQLSAEERSHLFAVTNRVADAQQASGLPWDGANILVNDGTAAGQHIAHVHIHVVPRVQGDGFSVIGKFLMRVVNFFGRAVDYNALEQIASRIRPIVAESKE